MLITKGPWGHGRLGQQFGAAAAWEDLLGELLGVNSEDKWRYEDMQGDFGVHQYETLISYLLKDTEKAAYTVQL